MKIFNRLQDASYFGMYFFLYCGSAAWLAFYNIHLLDAGYSGAQIGWINGVFQSAAFVVVPIWGMLADHFGTKKMLLITILADASFVIFLGQVHSFPLLLLFIFLLTLFHHPMAPLADTLTVNYMHDNPRISYGHMRAGGSLGWSVCTLVMGRVLLHADTQIIFPTAAVLLGVMALIVIFQIREKWDMSLPKFKFTDFWGILRNRQILIFLILMFIYGTCLAPLNLFINIYYYEIGATNQQIGYAFAIQAFAEVPMFFIATRIIRKIGTSKIMLATMVITIFRVILYSTAKSAWQAIPLGILNCFSFSLFWVAAVYFMHALIPPQSRGSGQSLLWAFHFGAGLTAGNILIGYIYQMSSMMMVMKLTAVCVCVTLIGFIWYFKKIARLTGK